MHLLHTSRLLSIALAAALGLGAATARADDTKSRWIAAIPFGAGQFQNGVVAAGVAFAAGEVLLGGASIATAMIVNGLGSTSVSSRAPGGAFVDIAAVNRSISTITTTNRVLFAGWAALTVAGVIQAEVSIVPSRAAPRDTPGPSVTATASPLPGGALIGLRAAF